MHTQQQQEQSARRMRESRKLRVESREPQSRRKEEGERMRAGVRDPSSFILHPSSLANKQLWPDSRLSEAIAEFLANQRGAERTRSETKEALFYYVEFVGADFPVRELPRDDPVEFLAWLSDTPSAPRKAHSLPKEVTPSSVAHFLACPPPRSQPRGPRSEQRLGSIYRAVRPFFAWLGMDTRLPADERPNLALPPPLVPTLDMVAAWWRHILSAPGLVMANSRAQRPRPVTRAMRRRGVLTQAYALLTGMRLGELLAACLVHVEGPWLLIPQTKIKRPRIIYQSPAALGIAAALRVPDDGQLTLFAGLDEPEADDRVAGWQFTRRTWSVVTRSCKLPGPAAYTAKPHQALRRMCSEFMQPRDAVAEAAQLGHGGGVVFTHYLDTLSRIPPVLDALVLPSLSTLDPRLSTFSWPDAIAVERITPLRLHEEYRRLVEGAGDRRQRRQERRRARQG